MSLIVKQFYLYILLLSGNSVKTVTKANTLMGHAEGKAQDAAIAKEVAVATTLLDAFLAEIATCCCITLMPGQHDPVNAMLPQRPLHPCILPLTSRYCANVYIHIYTNIYIYTNYNITYI